MVKEGFLSLDNILTWTVYVCHSEGEWARQDLSVIEQGMVVGAKRTGLCQELQRCWVFHAQQFPVCIKNGPAPKGHPTKFTQLWEALESHGPASLCTQLNIRKVLLMLCSTQCTLFTCFLK
jgi:hypothetical protein